MTRMIAYLTALLFTLPQLTSAQVAGVLSTTIKVASETGAKSFSAGFTKYGDLTYKILDEKGNIVRLFHIPAASAEAIESAKPSKIADIIKQLKNSPSAGQIIKSQMMRFPMESFTFFVALGAIAVKDVIFKYPDNPLAVQQFLASQKDPVGQVSFAAFMMTNGLVSQPLHSITNSPAMHKFIPYLGMSAGMLASHIVTEIAHFPGLAKCVTSKSVMDCDEAYKAWVDFNFKKKGLETIPSFVGLIGSTLVMGLVETAGFSAATKLVSMSAGAAVRVLAVNIALTMNPAGGITVAARLAFWGYQVAQIVGFLEVTNWIEIPFRHHWNNGVMIGPELKSSYQQIAKLINENRLLENQPSGPKLCNEMTQITKQDCQNDLPEELLHFANVMKEWRDNIAVKALTAHNLWVQNLANLSAGYNYSKRFYETFVSDVWESRFQKTADLVDMKRSYPLFGINTKNGKVDVPNYLTLQDVTEEDQLLYIDQVANEVVYELALNAKWVRSLPEVDKNTLMTIKTGLSSKEIKKITQALVVMNHVSGINNQFDSTQYQKEVVELVRKYRTKLGDPKPVLVPGQGYLKSLELLFSMDGLVSPFEKTLGSMWFNTSLEYLILQMMIGPEVSRNESVIKNNMNGFAADFVPPRIRIDGEHMVQQINKTDSKTNVYSYMENTIFNYKPTIEIEKNLITDQNIFTLMSNQGIHKNILGTKEKTNISTWWKQNVEPQYIQAWENYEEKYFDIIKDLYQVMWQRYSEFSNTSGFANGLIDSLRQEKQIYLQVLQTISALDQTAKDDLQRRLNIYEAKISFIEKLLSEIKLDPAVKGKFISRISAAQLDQAQKEATKALNEVFGPLNPSTNAITLKTLGILQINLKSNLDNLVAYGNVINAISYQERYASGTDKGAKCVQLKPAKTAGQLVQTLDCNQK